MADQASPSPIPNEKLVRIFATDQEPEALVVRGLLESADIDCDVVGENPPEVLPVGTLSVLVREEDVAQARQLLAEYRRSPEEARAEEAALDDAVLDSGSDEESGPDQKGQD